MYSSVKPIILGTLSILSNYAKLVNLEAFLCDLKAATDKYQTQEERELGKNIEKEKDEWKKLYKFSKKHGFDPDPFYFHHGLRFANQKIKDYIKGKDFIDGGAHIGDSVLTLREYKPNKIYSFEIGQEFAIEYEENMKLNNVDPKIYELVFKGLYDKKTKQTVQMRGASTSFMTGEWSQEIETIDLDTFVKERNFNIGFINLDLEGAEIDAIKGMKETLIKHRPVIICAIYHNPDQFFDLKPLLESFLEGYTYEISKYEPKVAGWTPIVATNLFAYPAELKD